MCEREISRMGKNNGNPDLVCEKNTRVYAFCFILFARFMTKTAK